MSLASAEYLLFVLLAAAVLTAVPRAGALVALSLLFYALWNPLYCLPLIATAGLDFSVARAIARTESGARRRALLAASVATNLGILGFFKYFDFLAQNAVFLGAQAGMTLPPPAFRVVFAVGISFYTFQSMAYVIDVYRRDAEPTTSFTAYLAFVSFFPTLLAGPITRPETLLSRVAAPPRPFLTDTSSKALFLIALGFLKKAVIADTLSVNLVDRVFDLPGLYSSVEVLFGIYAYAVQIYGDFSGYSDIAIGSALLLGFPLRDNFNAPYRARNLVDFWRRWHISFSSWLRDYLFFALPGQRGGGFRPYLNTVITFVIGGLWHGAAWTYVIWGLLHGIGLAVMRRFETPVRGRGPAAPATWRTRLATVAAVFVTFHFVCLAWVFFRAGSVAQALEVLGRLRSLSLEAANLTPTVLGALAAGLVTQWLPERWYVRAQDAFVRWPVLAQAAALLLCGSFVRLAGSSAVTPFIYFRY